MHSNKRVCLLFLVWDDDPGLVIITYWQIIRSIECVVCCGFLYSLEDARMREKTTRTAASLLGCCFLLLWVEVNSRSIEVCRIYIVTT